MQGYAATWQPSSGGSRLISSLTPSSIRGGVRPLAAMLRPLSGCKPYPLTLGRPFLQSAQTPDSSSSCRAPSGSASPMKLSPFLCSAPRAEPLIVHPGRHSGLASQSPPWLIFPLGAPFRVASSLRSPLGSARIPHTPAERGLLRSSRPASFRFSVRESLTAPTLQSEALRCSLKRLRGPLTFHANEAGSVTRERV